MDYKTEDLSKDCGEDLWAASWPLARLFAYGETEEVALKELDEAIVDGTWGKE